MFFIKIGKIWFVEKNFFTFPGRNEMFIPIFVEISFIPLAKEIGLILRQSDLSGAAIKENFIDLEIMGTKQKQIN